MIDQDAKDAMTRGAHKRFEAYALLEDRQCYICSKQFTQLEVAAFEGCVIQTFSGRVFCAGCWETYLMREGL